jgi:hypothetical protein
MINLPEGRYDVDQGYLVAPENRRLQLKNVTFEIWLDRQGRKRLNGRGFINNAAFSELLEDGEEVHIVLRFFDDYFLYLREPAIQTGKVFEPDTEASLLFSIGAGISFIAREDFLELTGLR